VRGGSAVSVGAVVTLPSPLRAASVAAVRRVGVRGLAVLTLTSSDNGPPPAPGGPVAATGLRQGSGHASG